MDRQLFIFTKGNEVLDYRYIPAHEAEQHRRSLTSTHGRTVDVATVKHKTCSDEVAVIDLKDYELALRAFDVIKSSDKDDVMRVVAEEGAEALRRSKP